MSCYADTLMADTAQEIKKVENYLAELKKLHASLQNPLRATETAPKRNRGVKQGLSPTAKKKSLKMPVKASYKILSKKPLEVAVS
jgi:hypothetical protein